ncbi:MAG: hypothetical protein RL742_366 [Bacteroidota bacterium]
MKINLILNLDQPEKRRRRINSEFRHGDRVRALQPKFGFGKRHRFGRNSFNAMYATDRESNLGLDVKPIAPGGSQRARILAGFQQINLDIREFISLQGFPHVMINLLIVAVEFSGADFQGGLVKPASSLLLLQFKNLRVVPLLAVAGEGIDIRDAF